jgi:hypothetical protein
MLYTRFLFCLGCFGQLITKYFLTSFVAIAQQSGQAAMLGRLSLSMYLRFRLSLLDLQTKYKVTGVLTRHAAFG